MEYTKIPHLSFSRDMQNILNSLDYEHVLKQQFCCSKIMENAWFCYLLLMKNEKCSFSNVSYTKKQR